MIGGKPYLCQRCLRSGKELEILVYDDWEMGDAVHRNDPVNGG